MFQRFRELRVYTENFFIIIIKQNVYECKISIFKIFNWDKRLFVFIIEKHSCNLDLIDWQVLNFSLVHHQLNQRPDTTLLRPEKVDDFMAGEMRVNEHPFLTTLHVVFFKEHNRIAKLLKEYLPTALQTVRS